MSWLQKLLPPRIKSTPGSKKTAVPEGLWIKCSVLRSGALPHRPREEPLRLPEVQFPRRVPARERIEQLLDPEGRFEIGSDVVPVDSLKFKDQKKYPERLVAALDETGETDALVVMQGSVKSVPLVLACFEFEFMGGSMGSVVGERFVRGVRVAYENRMPFVCISASGGARMQEGVNSLFQMAKTTAVLQELTRARLPVRVDPHRSDDGRRLGLVRVRGGPGARRARRADRFRGPARDRADRPRKTAGRLPARRIPDGRRARST